MTDEELKAIEERAREAQNMDDVRRHRDGDELAEALAADAARLLEEVRRLREWKREASAALLTIQTGQPLHEGAARWLAESVRPLRESERERAARAHLALGPPK